MVWGVWKEKGGREGRGGSLRHVPCTGIFRRCSRIRTSFATVPTAVITLVACQCGKVCINECPLFLLGNPRIGSNTRVTSPFRLQRNYVAVGIVSISTWVTAPVRHLGTLRRTAAVMTDRMPCVVLAGVRSRPTLHTSYATFGASPLHTPHAA